MFGFAAFADIPFAGLPSTYVSLSESVTATDSQSSALNAVGALTESVTATGSQSSVLNAVGDITESISATDSQSVTVYITASVLEELLAEDSQSGSLNAIASILEIGDTVDIVFANGSFYVTINETVYALDSVTGRYLWEPIDDTQTPAWSIINNNQTSTWTPITTS
jgi:hypothetical protein